MLICCNLGWWDLAQRREGECRQEGGEAAGVVLQHARQATHVCAVPAHTRASCDFNGVCLSPFSIFTWRLARTLVPEGGVGQLLLDTAVLIFARKEVPSRRDPSFMKTFRLMNKFMVPGSYMRDDGRVEVAKFDWSEDVKVTNSAACVRLNVSAT